MLAKYCGSWKTKSCNCHHNRDKKKRMDGWIDLFHGHYIWLRFLFLIKTAWFRIGAK